MSPFLIANIALISAPLLLVFLSIIDLRERLLPNVLVAPFAILALCFHGSTAFAFVPWAQVLLGGATGYLFLFTLRAAANAYYKQDSLGLGDVKLMGAAGLWLGVEGVLVALTLGAFAGLVHGVLYAAITSFTQKKSLSLNRLAIPAGPGFAVGIVLSGLWVLHDYPAIKGLANLLLPSL